MTEPKRDVFFTVLTYMTLGAAGVYTAIGIHTRDNAYISFGVLYAIAFVTMCRHTNQERVS